MSLPVQAAEHRWQPRTNLTFTMFNIKYYGLNGDHDGTQGSETRNAAIKDHLTRNNLWTDVMAFEEIVDVRALKRDITGERYSCESYDHNDSRHQHVVLCVRSGLRLVVADDDDNFTLENVQMERYRPAVHGIVETNDGERLAHVIAVHLKAQPNMSDVRIEQTHMIADYIYDREDALPVVLLGDVNTHGNDHELMSNILDDYGVDMFEVENPATSTFRTPGNASKLDRMWVTEGVRVVEEPRTYGPCTGDGWTGTITDYNRKVSDHCPVAVKLGL
jgi:endonuclease/exonuclease/phosphatase family metal-dependent hydrolase